MCTYIRKTFCLQIMLLLLCLTMLAQAQTSPSVVVPGNWEIKPIVSISELGLDITDVAVGQGGAFGNDIYYYLTGGSIYRVPPTGLPEGELGTMVASGLYPHYGFLEFGFDARIVARGADVGNLQLCKKTRCPRRSNHRFRCSV